MPTGKHLRQRADLCASISTRSMTPPGAPPVRLRRSSSHGPIPRRSGQARKGHAFFAYADNYLIDLKAAIILDVEPTRHSASGSRRGQNHDRPDRSMLWIKAADYAAIPLTALQRSSAGWSRKNQLSRMCRFGKKANGRMAHSAGPTSLLILLPIRTNARAAKPFNNTAGHSRISGPASPKTIRGFTGRASEIATHARSRRAVALVNLDAKSPEASMKRRAMG